MIRRTCAQTSGSRARRYTHERLRCARLCAAALLRLRLCISVSAARVADGAASPGLHIGKVQPRWAAHWLRCVKCLSLLACLLQPCWGCERDARRAHVVGGERRDTHTGKKRKREGCLACLRPSPLLTTTLPTSLLTPPSKRNRLPFPITTPFSPPLTASGMSMQPGMSTDPTPFDVACYTVTQLWDYLSRKITI